MTAVPAPRRAPLARAVLGLLALSCVYFAVRGPYRAWVDLDARDLTGLYAATRAWLDGLNPYDATVISDLAKRAGMVLGPAWSLHPPTTFVLLTPLASLPWPVAEKVSVIANLALEVACVALAMTLADLHLRQVRGLLFLAFVLSLAPFHTAISEGQLTIAVATLLVASLLAYERDRPVLVGLCIALAAALTPQMGLIFVLLLLLRGQWKALLTALLALTTTAGIGLARLAAAGVDWVPTLLSNLAASGVGDAAQDTTQRLNLQALLNVVLHDQGALAIGLVTYGVGLAAAASLFLGLRGRSDREANLLSYAGCSLITLLMFYNRSYGATLLVFALAWAIASFRPRELWPLAVVIAAATTVFLVPGAAALAHAQAPAVIAWTAAWWPFLQLHQVVALLVILGALLAAAADRGAGSAQRTAMGPAVGPGADVPAGPRAYSGSRIVPSASSGQNGLWATSHGWPSGSAT